MIDHAQGCWVHRRIMEELDCPKHWVEEEGESEFRDR
jgi:hypothetical protein